MAWSRLCVALAAVVSVASTAAGPMLGQADSIAWEPLANHHADRFFHTPAGSTQKHVHRRLQECTSFRADMDTGKNSLTNFADTVTTFDPKTTLSAKESISNALDWGSRFGNIKFESIVRGLEGFVAIGAGVLSVIELKGMFTDLHEFKEQVNQVFTVVSKIQRRVEELPNVIEYELNRAAYNRLFDDAKAEINNVFDVKQYPDAMKSACLAFDASKVSDLADAVKNYASICKKPNAPKDDLTPENLRQCLMAMGVSIGGVLAQLLSTMAVCISVRSPFSSAESRADLQTKKVRATQFFSSVASAIREIENGSGSGSGHDAAMAELDKAVAKFANSTSDIAAEAPATDDRVDSYIDKLIEGMNAYNYAGKDYAQRIANFTAQKGWKAMMESNPVARELGTAMALGIGMKYNQKMDRLSKLDDRIYSTYKEKQELLDVASNKVWDYHGQIMTQVGNLGTTFTNQFNQRMDRLNGVQNKVNTIQANVDTGFAALKTQLSDMGQQWSSQISDIDSEIVRQGGETTSFLSNAIAAATEQIGNRIGSIQSEVVEDHRQVMGALSGAQDRVLYEYGATRDTLYSASTALANTIGEGMTSLDSTVRQSFDAVTDAVARRLEDAHAHLSDMLTTASRALTYVDNRLMVFDSRVDDLSRQLDAVTKFLHDIHTTFESIAMALGNLPSSIRAELFKDRYEHLEDQYKKIRDGYADFVDANLTVSIMVGSCAAHPPYDLFQSFLELVDIPDADVPRQLERFANQLQDYERFGLIALGILKELAYLDGVCATLELGATFKEVRIKAQEQDNLIVAASATLVRHVEEVMPAYLLNVRAAELAEAYSTRDWTTQGPMLAEELRQNLQRSVGAFAHVSVIHAGLNSVLDVKHLDTDVDYANTKTARRRGIQVSMNKKLAVVWGNTKQLQTAAPLDAMELMRQGIFRGNITVSPPTPKCFLALAPGFYPVCDPATCACAHYEDFASETDPTAGRAVTRFATNDYASNFVVDAVRNSSVDYVLLAAAVSAKQLPVPKAYGALRAPMLVGKAQQPLARPVWESYTDTGAFNAVLSDVSGVRLSKNELVLDIEMRTTGQTLRQVFALFCNSEMQQVTVGTWLTFQYACKEVATAPQRLVNRELTEYPITTTGVPLNRLGLAVCANGSARKTCIVAGSMNLGASIGGAALAVGDQVQDVTLFKNANLTGEFVVCRQCSAADLATIKNMQSLMVGVPDVSVAVLNVECGQPGGRPNMLYCRETAA
jgi:hypothetical protein